MSATNRSLLEQTLFNLRYDMDCIGQDAEMWAEIAALSDDDLETVLSDLLAEM